MNDVKEIKPSEKKMVKAVSNLFRNKGFINQKTEAQICERFIDLACWDKKGKEIIAVEAKVKAPARAFEQASRYGYVADYVYVAILRNGCNKRAKELAIETGIGLIFVRRDSLDRYYADVERKPAKSKYKDKNLTKYILGVTTK